MTNKINLHQPIAPVQPGKRNQHPKDKQSIVGPSFDAVLRQTVDTGTEVKFSKHAQQRLSSRNITLEPQQVEKLNQAVQRAGEKGARESLVLMNDLAFIVSVPNKTVVTAVDGQSLKENVFTNIDSAVIV